MATVAATLVEKEEAGGFVLAAAGEWLVATAAELDRRLRALQVPSGKRVALDLAGIDRLDTAGAWLLLRTEHDLTERGNAVEMRNLRPSFRATHRSGARGCDNCSGSPSPAWLPYDRRFHRPKSGRFRSRWSPARTASSASSALSAQPRFGWPFTRAGWA